MCTEKAVATIDRLFDRTIRNPLFLGVVIVMMIGFLAAMQYRGNQETQEKLSSQLEQLTDIAARNRATFLAIQDCTTPGGQCFQRSQAATSAAVASINVVTRAAATCARFHDSEAAIESCITARLAARG